MDKAKQQARGGLIGATPKKVVPQEAATQTPATEGGFAEQSAAFVQHIYEKIEPKDEQSLNRVVRAGAQVMFSEQTHKYMQQMLEKEGDMAGKLGYGIVELMGLLLQQSKGNIPAQILAPAATILLVKACEFTEQQGEEMNMDIFSDALEITIAGLKKNIDGMSQWKQPPEPAQPEQPMQAEQPTGLVGAQPQGV